MSVEHTRRVFGGHDLWEERFPNRKQNKWAEIRLLSQVGTIFIQFFIAHVLL